MLIKKTEAIRSKTNGQTINIPLLPIKTPIVRPKAPGATKIPGAKAFLKEKFKLMLPPPTWKKALPSPERITTSPGILNTNKEDITRRQPAIADSLGTLSLSTKKPKGAWSPKARILYRTIRMTELLASTP